ncbi:MAG: dephospho-CoA kinase [Proteobacteria bacterium]|nr:dephospho-CoA kinase [Pseudomonadota bacterium]
MLVLGVTGSIGMGKSTASALLRHLKIPVSEADRVVYGLFARGGAAVAAVERAFPGAVVAGAIDRKVLGQRVFGNAEALARLNAIVHPLVRAAQAGFLAAQRRRRVRLAALDIPLLFETGGERRCDATLVVTAPVFVQRARVLARSGMTADKLQKILSHQLPDAAKRRRADFVVPTGLGKRMTLRHLRRIVRRLKPRGVCGKDA